MYKSSGQHLFDQHYDFDALVIWSTRLVNTILLCLSLVHVVI